jgi:hypothetical protein
VIRRWSLWLLPAWLLPLAALQGASLVQPSMDLSLLADDNVTRANQPADIREDTVASLGVQASFNFEPGPSGLWKLELDFLREEFAEFEGLSNSEAGLRLAYRFQFSRGYSAPIWELFSRVAVQDFQSRSRDQTEFLLGISGGRRLTDRITFLGGLELESHQAPDSEAFDTEQVSLFANLDYFLGDRWIAYGTYRFIDGQIVSTGTPELNILTYSEVVEPDEVFGGADSGQFAYRLASSTQLLTLGLNWAITSNNALDLSVRTLVTSARAGLDYERLQLRASYLGRF